MDFRLILNPELHIFAVWFFLIYWFISGTEAKLFWFFQIIDNDFECVQTITFSLLLLLIAGNWYYISLDTYNSSYDETFSLRQEDNKTFRPWILCLKNHFFYNPKYYKTKNC